MTSSEKKEPVGLGIKGAGSVLEPLPTASASSTGHRFPLPLIDKNERLGLEELTIEMNLHFSYTCAVSICLSHVLTHMPVHSHIARHT